MESAMLNKTKNVLEIYSKRGIEGKVLNRLYRQLFRPELYEKAYVEIYANLGSTTKGTSKDTLDGMSKERIGNIIQNVKQEQHRWKPVRRTYIPKGNGKSRPLGIPSGDDKLLQAAMKILLEAYYEPTFSKRSHGFRPGKGCHTALTYVGQSLKDTNWFIEGDIKGCFDNIDHDILLGIIGEKIEDGRFLNLTKQLLKAGYMENWKTIGTYSGTPQGGIISPLLTNIYLDVFDKWVERELLPKYNRSLHKHGGRRKNPEYARLSQLRNRAKKAGDYKAHKLYGEQRRPVPSVITNDEGFRKLEYVRYADDFLLSFAGPKSEAEEIKREISQFLKDRLKLELSEEKTLITHARSQKANFLGYELSLWQGVHNRQANGKMRFGVPKEVVTRACRKYTKKGKPVHRAGLLMLSDIDLITIFQAEYRGLVNYYRMAHNIHALSMVGGVTQASLLKTLASKYKTSVSKVSKRYRTTIEINGTCYKVLEAVVKREGKADLKATFGAVSLTRNPNPAKIADEYPLLSKYAKTSQLIDRLKAEQCEMCGKTGMIEVHHVRKLKDVNKPGRKKKPEWVHRMAAIHRKTLMTCQKCHDAIHMGNHLPEWDSWKDSLESRVR
jgi:group II intron reverse transcriptase/maturase